LPIKSLSKDLISRYWFKSSLGFIIDRLRWYLHGVISRFAIL